MQVLGIAGAHRKVDVRLPGKGNSNSHGARPVHLIITMIKWIRIIRYSGSLEHTAFLVDAQTFSLPQSNHVTVSPHGSPAARVTPQP